LYSLKARIAQLVEHDLAKVGVAGSNPVSRSKTPSGVFFFAGEMYLSTVNIHDLYHQLAGTPWESDTRKDLHGKTFIALKGERFDGNTFVEQALEAGAKHVLSDDARWKNTANVFFVSDVLETITALAAYHRTQWKGKLIAVAGSNGKTTTKELMQAALRMRYACFATPGNFNNHIGVPLSLWQINSTHDWAIIELGANHPGETLHLAQIASPDLGIITNHGKDHLEGFGSVEAVRKANTELFDYLRKHNGFALVNGDDAQLLEDSKGLERYTFGTDPNSYLAYQAIEGMLATIKVLPEGPVCQSNLAGGFNSVNIAAALCLARIAEIPLETASEGIQNYKPSLLRSQQIELNGMRIRLDAYNANPSSMELSILAFAKETKGPHCLLLADMLEMGEYTEQVHKECVELLQSLNFKEVWLVGPAFCAAVSHIQHSGFRCFPDRASIPGQVLPEHWKGCDVLIKGSRGFALEKVLG